MPSDPPQTGVELRACARHLLQRPLTCKEHDPDIFRLIRRHEANLDRWFSQRLGYRLHVDADTARLFKLGALPVGCPLRTRTGRTLSPLEYVLLALILSATAAGPAVTSLRDLVEQVRSAAAEYMGTDAALIALTDSTSMGIGLMYGGLRLRRGDELLTTEHDFYATHEALRFAALRSGARVRRVALYDDPAAQKEFVAAPREGLREATLILDRIRCAACLWLNEQSLRRVPGVLRADVNFTTQRAQVAWDPAVTKLSAILEAIRAIVYDAYPFDPRRSDALARAERRLALWRLFVAGFGAMQVMINRCSPAGASPGSTSVGMVIHEPPARPSSVSA